MAAKRITISMSEELNKRRLKAGIIKLSYFVQNALEKELGK